MVVIGASSSFVGRTADLAHLRSRLAATAGGQGHAVLIEGEAGIGKTRLLDEALGCGADLGIRLWRAQAEELDSRRPFAALADCLGITRNSPDPRRAVIAHRLFGDPGRGDVAPASEARSEFRLGETLIALVEDLCTEGPVAIVVDDLQWADAETLLVLYRLSRLTNQLPLLVVGAYRPSPRPPNLARMIDSTARRGSSPLTLGPLGVDAVATLAADILGTPPGPRLTRQVATAQGNPLLITELIAALRASGSITSTNNQAEIGANALPDAVKLTILHRMSLLSTDTLGLLRMASIMGTAFSVGDLAAVLGRQAVTLAPLIREAMDAGVLGDEGDQMAFRHDLLREALYEDLPLALRTSLHRDVALALAAMGAPALDVAEHFVRGVTPDDDVAREWLQRVADEVTVQAPEVAAALLRRAIGLFEPGFARDHVMADLVVSLDMSGRVAEAEAVCRDLLTRTLDPRTEVRVRLALSRALSSDGRFAGALAQLADALQIEGLSAVQRARALANASNLYVRIPDLAQAEDLARRALAEAAASGDEIARAEAALTLSTVAIRAGRFLDALAWAEKAKVLRDTQPSQRMAEGWPHLGQAADLALGTALMRLDRLAEAETVLTGVRRATERSGFKRLLFATYRSLIVCHYLAGDWDDAVAEFNALVDLCEELDDRSGALVVPSSVCALIAVHRGDLNGARDLISQEVPSREQIGVFWPARARAALAGAAKAAATAGEPSATTLAILWQEWEASVAWGTTSAFAPLGPDIVRVAIAEGDLGVARGVAAAVAGLASVNPTVASVVGATLCCRGLVDNDPGLLLDSAAAYSSAGRPLESALAVEDAADLLGRLGRSGEARALFERAIAAYELLDAVRDSARAAARMRAQGMRRGRKGVRRRPTRGWDALTPSELAVVELVAEGLSNPEVADRLFLSRPTVKAHVASAFRKLAVSSRVELAREATRRVVERPG